MDEETKLRGEVERAEKAEAILKEPLVIAALEACHDHAYKQFLESTNPEEAMAARRYVDAISTFTKNLKDHIRTGQLARPGLESLLAAAASKVARLTKRRA